LLLGLIITALVLMTLDQFTRLLVPSRALVGSVLTPLFVIADMPYRTGLAFDDVITSHQRLLEENRRLHDEVLALSAKAQRNDALEHENQRLRSLLGSKARMDTEVLVAELIGIVPDPDTQQVILDKGADDGVFKGQAVVDAYGLVGQVIEARGASSRVLLVTDVMHDVPVQVNRNDVRAIATGGGVSDRLELNHVPLSADMRPGDLLVTSGLGRVFPPGYPVAVVDRVVHDPGQPFATVTARPTARLMRSRHLLLVFRTEGDASHEGFAQRDEDGP
jgi:rod shape-determining protein MreC